ncbi:MAG: PHP domain-containing protein [Synergistaceae bacterium]|nr:PHP domain-containing protein [Synergistaceae bacterium]
MLKIDLHFHSTFSDGFFSPAELVQRLKACKVIVAGLTDHDTIDGVGEFLALCRKASIKGVAGVELSASYMGVLHILGYRFDTANSGLLSALEKNRNAREARNILIFEKLRELGFDVRLEEAAAYANGVVGRPHIARLLWNKGYVSNLKTAFDKYLKRGAAAYVPRLLLQPEECVGLIREAGGLPVLAHPRQTTPDLDDLPPVLRKLKDAGLWGLECRSQGNSPSDVYRLLEIAANFELFPTAGSDFHGGGHANVAVGVIVEEDTLPWGRLCGGL